MTPQEILVAIQRLPPNERRIIEDSLDNQKSKPASTHNDLINLLLADGVINEIPDMEDDPEWEEYEPVILEGEPLSELIIRERR